MRSMLYFAFSMVVPMVGLVGLSSCATEAERRDVGPTSHSTPHPWNTPSAGSGQGALGMLQQNKARR